jgi:hypothetical protein
MVRDPFELDSSPFGWLDYGDQQLAPLRRSQSGLITVIMKWLDYGDHGLAP